MLKYIFYIVVWTILGLYLLYFLTFKTPMMQAYIGERLARLAAQTLGTSVDVGRADYSFPNRLTLYDVIVRDQQGEDMLKSRRLSARIDLLPLTEGKISIASAQLFSTHAVLYQRDSLNKPNFQFALDSLASKDTTDSKPIDLHINSLIMRHSSVSYDRYDRPQTPGELNLNHLRLTDISAHVILKTLTPDTLNANIKRLSFKEHSGLDVRELSMKYEGGRWNSLLQDFVLKLPGTDIRLGDCTASYRFRGDHFVMPSLNYRGSLEPSTLTPSDLACLLPSLKTFNTTLSLESTFIGQGEDLDITSLYVSSTTGDIDIDADGWVKDLTQDAPNWFADINDLRLSDKTVNFISENLNGRHVEVPAIVTRLGNIHLKGFAKGTGVQDIITNSQLNTDAGNVSCNLVISGQREFNGKVHAEDIDLRHLLDNDHFGRISTQIMLSGLLPGKGQALAIEADGLVSAFDYNGYHYQNINLDGSYSADGIKGKLDIDDPNLKLAIDGFAQRQGRQQNVRLAATIDNFSPHAMRLTDKWADARFAAHIETDVEATSLRDAIGTVTLSDFTMTAPDNDYRLERLHIASDVSEDVRRLTLTSDFAEASITGNYDLETLPQSITNLIAAKLPTLPGLPKVNPDVSNNFSVHATVSKSDWLQRLLGLPLELGKPLTLNGTVNDRIHQLDVECSIPQFRWDGGLYEHTRLSVLSPMGTLIYNVTTNKFTDDGDFFELQLQGSAHNNQLTNSLTWNNHTADPLYGRITAMAEFGTSMDGQETVTVTFSPSKMTMKETEWDILPSHIRYSDNRLEISNFTIRHDDQHLLLDGVASAHAADSLTVSMRGVEIAYVLDLVNFHSVDFSGLATGEGCLRGLFGELQANGHLDVEQFKFQDGRMGTLHADVAWNKEKEQIDIHAIADDGPGAKTYINGFVAPGPGPGAIDLDIRTEGAYLDFAQSFTKSFISHIDGHARGAVRLAGPLDAINLTGQLVLDGHAHVTALGCTYELRNDTLRLVPNDIIFADCAVYDIHGNRGIMTGGIHHQELTNLTYDIYVAADRLMAYDFPDFGSEIFYGTAFVEGTAAIHGRDNSVLIEADVTPVNNSFLVVNAATPETINNAEFIQWGTPLTSHLSPLTSNISLTSNPSPLTSNNRSDINLRLKVATTPDATLRILMDATTNDYITLHGHGDLQANYYNKGSFTMFGNYEVDDGTYEVTIQNIIKKNFTFSQGGTIVFGGDPYDASLNLQAQHTVSGVSLSELNVGRSFSNSVRVNCLMNITGTPNAPLVDFDLDLLNVNSDEKQMVRSLINGQDEMKQQVIYLLAVGRFYPQGSNNADQSEQQSSTSLAMQSLLSGTLSGQINSVLSQVIKSNNWNFGANISTGDEGWNNAEYEGIVNGRLLNNRLLINGQFGYRDNATTANPSFIGDFDVRYLLYPSGNLALKVYNQTNDRYFTKSSLNTQGIGLIMKKDFNGWRDLFTTERKKKNKEK